MKALQKMILPALLAAAILIIYFIYFAPSEGAGLYSNFDTNNNANKEIRVYFVKENGIQSDPMNQTATFYAADGAGVQNLVQAPFPLPQGMEEAEFIIMTGHLHDNHFHAVDIKLP
jgi:cytochrome c-type biogenesis protein CcmE